jgi:hypothetical protein
VPWPHLCYLSSAWGRRDDLRLCRIEHPLPCTTSTWQQLIGDVWLSTSTSNLVKSYTVSTPTPYTIKVHLQPATEISTKESAALTQPVTILDNGVSVGTATLAAGDFAQFPITSPPAGTHVYTIRYPGDANYPRSPSEA